MTELGSGLADLGVRRPQRADAARNVDALLTAARGVFAEPGADASLEDVARRAGVGIGTLYRNVPTRRDLVERLHIGEVADLCAIARAVADLPPGEALAGWLQRFVDYIATKQAIKEALTAGSPVFTACRAEMYDAGTPLVDRAQAAGEVRTDLTSDDLVKMLAGITSVSFADDAQRDRVVTVALDGVRAHR